MGYLFHLRFLFLDTNIYVNNNHNLKMHVLLYMIKTN